jgi:hypothetical protein
MTTAINIIERALRTINVLGTDEPASADQASDGLDSLNDVLSAMSNEKLMVYEMVLENFPLIAAQASYTIGPSGNFNTTRPIAINNAYIRWSSLDYPLELITVEQYDGLTFKANTSEIPFGMYVNDGFPTTTLKFYPTPKSASASVYIESTKAFTAFASTATSVSLPPGYERLLRLLLAVDMMPEYGVKNDQIIEMARDAKAWIKRTNTKPGVLNMDSALPGRKHVNNIFAG